MRRTIWPCACVRAYGILVIYDNFGEIPIKIHHIHYILYEKMANFNEKTVKFSKHSETMQTFFTSFS